MNPEEEIFEAAAALPPADRAAYLDEACTGQPELRARIEALLRSHDVTGFMEEGATEERSPDLSNERAQFQPEQSGERIGRYRLLQQIGEGGFGTVWMAEQLEPVTRRVALKIIKAGMDTKEVIARFEAERQALAMMDHPNIAKVHDAGATDKGRPYFVMELVKGIPITRFCDEQQFTTRQRLELFADVCSAINHAHQKGVIHRDIKPSNVMVTLNADRPVVKVIDFGIAKATQGKLTEHTLFTRFDQFLGTPAYMSPEQAAITEVDIDTRSDIYGLGILLYELLTGKPPFDAKSLISAGYEEMRRIIREVEPARPSARLHTIIGDERTALASARHIAPEKLRRMVEPDLDWIVMKAIEKDRTRRYETANGLALDIQRFLTDEPVSAGPPSARYRFRKFARRHKTALRAGIAAAVFLTAAAGAGTWLAIRATDAENIAENKAADESAARADAETARSEAETLNSFLLDTFSSPQPLQKGSSLTVVQAMEYGLKKLKTQFADYPKRRHKLQRRIVWLMHTLGKTSEILPLAEETRDYYAATHPSDHLDAIGAQRELASYYIGLQRWDEATDILEPLYKAAKPLLVPEHSHAGGLVLIMANLASCYYATDRRKDARVMREQLLEYQRQRPIKNDHVAIVWAKDDLAVSYFEEGRWDEALQLREATLPFHYKTHNAANPKALFTALENLAQSFTSVGREPDALRLRSEAQRIRQVSESGATSGSHAASYQKATQAIVVALNSRKFKEAVAAARELVRTYADPVPIPVGAPNPEAWLANALLLEAAAHRTAGQEGTPSPPASLEAATIILRLCSLDLNPAESAGRVELFMRCGHWQAASNLSLPYYRQFPGNPWTAFSRGPLLVKTGEIRAYEQLCDEMVQRFSSAGREQLEAVFASLLKSYRPHVFDITARILCLRQPSEANLKWASILADQAVKQDKDPHHLWYVLGRAMVSFREGDHAKAASSLELILPRLQAVAAASAHAIVAMSKHRLQDPEGAQKRCLAGRHCTIATGFRIFGSSFQKVFRTG